MFTGLIEAIGLIEELTPSSSKKSLHLKVKVNDTYWSDCTVGDSIANNGCCLTIVDLNGPVAGFDVSQETCAVTNFSRVSIGTKVNLEKALRMGDRLGGHLVSGHVDGLGELVEVTPSPDGTLLKVLLNRSLSRYVIQKGSICLDGISLTVNELEDRDSDSLLSLMIIPETWSKTHLSSCERGWRFNIEVDMMAKFSERLGVRQS